jgi:hypothetical protein
VGLLTGLSVLNNLQTAYANYQISDARGALADQGEQIGQIRAHQKTEEEKREFQNTMKQGVYELDEAFDLIAERLNQVGESDVTAWIGALVYTLLHERFFRESGINECVLNEIPDKKFLGALFKKYEDCRLRATQVLQTEIVESLTSYVDHTSLIPLLDRYCRWRSIKELLPAYPKTVSRLATWVAWGWVAFCVLVIYAGFRSPTPEGPILTTIIAIVMSIIFGLISVGVIRWTGWAIQRVRWATLKAKVNAIARPMGIAFGTTPFDTDVEEALAGLRAELAHRGIDTNRPDSTVQADLEGRKKWFDEVCAYYGLPTTLQDIFADAGYIDSSAVPEKFRGQGNPFVPIVKGAAQGGWIGLRIGASVAAAFAAVFLLLLSFGRRDD